MPRAGYSAFRPGTHTAPRHLTDGARGPKTQTHPVNLQTASNQNLGPKPGPSRCVQTPTKITQIADSDEAGQAFRQEAGHWFRFEAGRGSDLMPATLRVLPLIGVMMFCPAGLVKR